MDFEANLRQFGVWQTAVWAVAAAAIAAVIGWAVASYDAQSATLALISIGTATLLSLMTIAIATSLARIRGGTLTRRAGVWTFTPDTGRSLSGPLSVALDLGGFLLLRLGERRGASVWLPVQRTGLENDWHALRCAVYAPPPGGAPSHPAHPSPE